MTSVSPGIPAAPTALPAAPCPAADPEGEVVVSHGAVSVSAG
ncbi:hypothetical protein [Brachybacterium sp. P6-10-X1]|nr:hypothetical protein [Brachybacterium sp. P6-10-X1]